LRFPLKSDRKTRSANVWFATYMIVLLLLFVLGVLENRVDSEGMGFLPLLVLTSPWSWLLIGTWDFAVWGSGPHAGHLAIFVTCNILSGTANSLLFFLLIKWRRKNAATANPEML
jgi:hypothetical protein